MIKTLLAHGADVNAKLKAPLQQRNHTAGDPGLGEGATPFMRAAKSGDADLMTMLLEKGADPAIVLRNHTTALMIAAADGRPSLVALLVHAGANIAAQSERGDTALSIARAKGHEAVIKLLDEPQQGSPAPAPAPGHPGA